MSVMAVPEFWATQDRMLTVDDMENMPDDPGAIPGRAAGRYVQAARVTSDEPFTAVRPFPVTVIPAELVTIPGQ